MLTNNHLIRVKKFIHFTFGCKLASLVVSGPQLELSQYNYLYIREYGGHNDEKLNVVYYCQNKQTFLAFIFGIITHQKVYLFILDGKAFCILELILLVLFVW